MNPMGKILVFLNLLFALATGAFLAYVVAIRENYADALEKVKKELEVATENTKAQKDTIVRLTAEARRLQASLEGEKIRSGARETEYQAALEHEKEQARIARKQREKADASAAQANMQVKRMQGEVELLTGIVKKREDEILVLNKQVIEARARVTTAETAMVTAVARAKNLFEQLKIKEQLIAELQNLGPGGGRPTVVTTRDPNYENPPPGNLKGRIIRIDSVRPDLVEISLGSDHGLKKDHTLEIYRLSPEPTYLGRVLIVDPNLHTAIGRLQRTTGVGQLSSVQTGDEVVSKLIPY
jgi:hypothetical protein